MSFLTFSTAQSNIRICVRGDSGDKMSLMGSCLRVKKGYSCHYLFLVKCLLQTRHHMGWWVPPHPARAKRDPAQMTLDGDAPGGGSSQRRLWCISGWQCDFQLFSPMPQRHFKCLSDANPVGTSWLWSLYLFLWEAQNSTPLEYFLRIQINTGLRGRARDRNRHSLIPWIKWNFWPYNVADLKTLGIR